MLLSFYKEVGNYASKIILEKNPYYLSVLAEHKPNHKVKTEYLLECLQYSCVITVVFINAG